MRIGDRVMINGVLHVIVGVENGSLKAVRCRYKLLGT
jgi:hypothetical protein